MTLDRNKLREIVNKKVNITNTMTIYLLLFFLSAFKHYIKLYKVIFVKFVTYIDILCITITA